MSYSATCSDIGRIGASEQAQKILGTYLKTKKEYISVLGEKSGTYSPDCGIGQGRPLSGVLFNTALYSNEKAPTGREITTCYSDDQIAAIYGNTVEGLVYKM